ncbi:MAG: hypothetical protein AAF564_06180 [Bacteroidota bacterium]
MFLIFDNLSATLIGIAVLLLLVIMQQRVQRVSAEQVMMYAANQNILDFGKWVEEDMVNVGWGVTTGNGISGIAQNDTIPTLTRQFTFDRKQSDTTGVATVQYQVIPVTTSGQQVFMEINGTDVPLWQVQRLVGGTVTGESAPYVTHFNILLENDRGQNVFAVADAEQISIEVAMAMPYGEDAYIPETHWGTTFGLLAAN